MKAYLALEDGLVFEGEGFGAEGETAGEIVFNTSLTGYQEILTDPSYKGQIVTMTYPHIGNYGINPDDEEALHPWAEGFIIKELSPAVSNYRSQETLDQYLKRHQKIGIQNIDTRKLVKHLRDHGAKKGILSTVDQDSKRLVKKAQESPGIVGVDLVKEVTCKTPYRFEEGLVKGFEWGEQHTPSAAQTPLLEADTPRLLRRHPSSAKQRWTLASAKPRLRYGAAGDPSFGGQEGNAGVSKSPLGEGYREAGGCVARIVALDCGIKRNILRKLNQHGFEVTVYPASAAAEEILSQKPAGVFLSNGPGDPAAVPYVVETVRQLIGKVPIFGICLGHQILGLALGGTTSKLKFGHRGGNHPVMDLKTRKIEITSQNHGFVVDLESLPKNEIEITHINLNDRTLEGIQHKKYPIFSVQYHPENSPGPHDSDYLFKRFREILEAETRR